MSNYAFPRIPSTPEQAEANVRLEAEFREAVAALKAHHNKDLADLRRERIVAKLANADELQQLRLRWELHRADIAREIDRVKDIRAQVRQDIHDGVTRDPMQLSKLTEQIYELRRNLAKAEADYNQRVSETKRKLEAKLDELGRQRIEVQDKYHRDHSALRQLLAARMSANRAQALAEREAAEDLPESGLDPVEEEKGGMG